MSAASATVPLWEAVRAGEVVCVKGGNSNDRRACNAVHREHYGASPGRVRADETVHVKGVGSDECNSACNTVVCDRHRPQRLFWRG